MSTLHSETVPCTPPNLLLFANFVRDNHALFGGPNAKLVAENITEASGVLAAYVAECKAWRAYRVLREQMDAADPEQSPAAYDAMAVPLAAAWAEVQRAMAVVDKLTPAAP